MLDDNCLSDLGACYKIGLRATPFPPESKALATAQAYQVFRSTMSAPWSGETSDNSIRQLHPVAGSGSYCIFEPDLGQLTA